MISLEEQTEKLLTLTTIEQAFKYVYEEHLPLKDAENHPQVQAILKDDPVSRQIAHRILNDLPLSPMLSEDRLFMPGVDIQVQPHMRYHPLIPHCHDFFEIQYVLCGSFRQKIGESTVLLEPGDFCFIAPSVYHSLEIFDDDTIMLNLLLRKRLFPGSFLNLIPDSSDLISGFFLRSLYAGEGHLFLVNHTGSDENIRFIISRLLEQRGLADNYSARLNHAYFEELFLYMLKDHSKDFYSEMLNRRHWKKIQSILAYIQDHYTEVDLQSLAARYNYNPSYLSRILKNYTGRSFTEIIKELRFNQAVRLLVSTDESIENIILGIGYTDQTYFYREFKKKYGMPPAEYRRLASGNDAGH